jgi:hypothetical protein
MTDVYIAWKFPKLQKNAENILVIGITGYSDYYLTRHVKFYRGDINAVDNKEIINQRLIVDHLEYNELLKKQSKLFLCSSNK